MLDALAASEAPNVFNPWRQSAPLDVSPTGHFARVALYFYWVQL
jgi:hypothetical protein